MTCIYCDGQRKDDRMSLEHIWPQSLGGAVAGPLFQTRSVCQTCNNLAGIWIDGAFLKSWLVSHEASFAARQYLDPKRPGPSLLTYMGIDQEFPVQREEICERWVGPAGEHVYHIHVRDDDRWYGYAGGDFIKRKRLDGGRAYLVLTSRVNYWSLTGLYSFVEHFSDISTRLFCLTVVVGMPSDLEARFVAQRGCTEVERKEIDWIKGRQENKVSMMNIALRIDFSDRFLAKIALGVGANILGKRFLETAYVKELRKLLWLKDPDEKSKIRVRGTNIWNAEKTAGVSNILSWGGAWTLFFWAQPEQFSLHICTPSSRGMNVVISDEPELWRAEQFDDYKHGAIFIVIPERKCFSGPVGLAAYLNHRNGHNIDPNLASLEALRIDPGVLPGPR
ncbi:HNH endonuclease [Roseiarcus fermentans]|uniref:HNH endonuclease n=1 Tax=Roseiarcus fermentans TaxID=1473586 RepID=A0A366FE43_9HYPH|nr:HNH endonuclease [Roseiarcus fermentans]RBP12952.1 HNH endonuclease [Roseiarcus fermentans]